MTDLRPARPLDQRTFAVDNLPCPVCGQVSIIGVYLVNEQQQHNHTWYVCTFWPSPGRCGWTGWAVPGPEDTA